jgi:hypothetical protein
VGGLVVVKHGDYGGHRLKPFPHVVMLRRGGKWCNYYQGMGSSVECFNSLEDALNAVFAGMYDYAVLVIMDYDVLLCRCMNCNHEGARTCLWKCTSLKDYTAVPATCEWVIVS